MNPNAPVFVPGLTSARESELKLDGLEGMKPEPEPEPEPKPLQPEPEPQPEPQPKITPGSGEQKKVNRSQLAASLAALHEQPRTEAQAAQEKRKERLAAPGQETVASAAWNADLAMAQELPLDGDEQSSPRLDKPNTALADFTVLHVVGRGGFGKVMQVQHRDSGEIFALKTMRKNHVVQKNDVVGVRTERSVLTRIRHPFIIKLKWAFHTPEKLYLVMEFVNGGTLFFWMRKMGLFTEPQAQFFASELLLALEHLHSHSIVHRDVKPENVLLQPSGHIILTDFGCAKEYQEISTEDEKIDNSESGTAGDTMRIGAMSRSMVGTECYMAPEVLKREEHDKSIDFWSYGVLLFEMLTGDLPYYHKNKKKMIDAIKIAKKPKFPKYISSQACQLVKALLEKVPAKRPDVLNIKASDFFKGIDWIKLFNLAVTPPVKPQVAGPMDISNIPDKYTKDEAPVDSPVSPSSLLSPTKADLFSGFTFDGDDGAAAAELLQRAALVSSASPEDPGDGARELLGSFECQLTPESNASTLDSNHGQVSPSQNSHPEGDSDDTGHRVSTASDDGVLFELSPSLLSVSNTVACATPTQFDLN